MKAKKSKKGIQSQESDPDNDNKSDKSDNSNEEVDTDNSPKIIPVAKLPDKLRTKKIVLNISDTQYPIIQEVAEQLGWVIEREEGVGDWDIWWTDRQITPDTLFKMSLYQKINHFPGIYVLARKNMLGLNLMAMRDRFQTQYSFFPQTWVIPLQFAKFRSFYEQVQKGKTRTYIVKPEALSQGRGIFLTRNIQDIMTGRKYVVQRYLKNPLLIDDLKFDLRIYVLLAGTDPLRLYLYEQGLARFATKKYQQPNDQNLNAAFIHLTNYSLNKKNPQYVYNTSEQDMNVGHKRTLSSTYQYLEKKGYDVKKLKEQIQDVIIKTIIAGLPAISHQYQYCQPQEYENNMCFHILGVDVMITSDLKPYLIEINHTPSFETGTPLDYKVKKGLIRDSLKLMRVTTKNKKILFEKAKQLVKRRVETGKREIVKGQKRQQLLQEAQNIRDRQEEGLLGGFKKIYPVKQDPLKMQAYKKMIQHAEQVHKETQETRRKIIRDDQEKMKAKKRNGSQPENNKQHKSEHKQRNGHHNPRDYRDSNLPFHPEKHVRRQSKDRQLITQNIQIQLQLPHLQKQTFSQKVIEDRQKEREIPISTYCIGGSNLGQPFQKGSLNKINIFRTKTKKNVYNPKQQFIKFSQFMLNYLSSNGVKKDSAAIITNNNQSDEEAFYKMKKAIGVEKKKPLLSCQKDKNCKQGAYVIPKMYQIVDSKATVRIQAELLKKSNRQKQSPSPQISQSQKLVKSFNSYKGMHKSKKFSLF